jgi:hypothetical protein
MSSTKGYDIARNETANFASQWREYGRRRLLALFFLYSLLPVCVVSILISSLEPHRAIFALPVMPVWLGATWAAIWWAGEFRCPRCWRRFGAVGSKGATGSWSRGLFDDICHNCRVRKFTELE